MSCSPNTPIKWSDIYAIGQKIDSAIASLSLSSKVQKLADTVPLFKRQAFVETEIEYYWHFDYSTVQTPCEEISDHGFEITGGFSFGPAEQYAFDNDRLHFVGAHPSTGKNANSPCFCCVIGKVTSGVFEHTYALAKAKESSCHNSPDWESPCPDFFNLAANVELKAKRSINKEDADGLFFKEFELCRNSDKELKAGYKWFVENEETQVGRYRLAVIKIPLTGFFGWDIRKSEFDSITSKMTQVLSESCGAKEHKVYQTGTNYYVFPGCPVALDQMAWTYIEKPKATGHDKPGCVATSDPDVLNFPWNGTTCPDGSENPCEGPKVYCNTITHLDLLAGKLTDAVEPYSEDCSSSATIDLNLVFTDCNRVYDDDFDLYVDGVYEDQIVLNGSACGEGGGGYEGPPNSQEVPITYSRSSTPSEGCEKGEMYVELKFAGPKGASTASVFEVRLSSDYDNVFSSYVSSGYGAISYCDDDTPVAGTDVGTVVLNQCISICDLTKVSPNAPTEPCGVSSYAAP